VRTRKHTVETFQVWRLSPVGIELLTNDSLALDPGDEVELALDLGRQSANFQKLRVHSRHQACGRELVGIRWSSSKNGDDRINDKQRRSAPRWTCAEDFLPSGVAPNPVRFDDLIHFRVREVGSNGFQLLTSLRNKLMVPGMLLNATIDFPTLGKVEVPCRIVYCRPVSERNKECMVLGVKAEGMPTYGRKILGQYLLQFGPSTTVKSLRDAGLIVESGAKAMEFGFVRTTEDYQQVLELRAAAYGGAGKLGREMRPDELSDSFDTKARIVVGRYRGRVVASMRMMFPNDGDALEHEQFVTLPPDAAQRSTCVEVTRVCTSPEYRGTDLLLGLFRHGGLAALEAGRSFVLGSSDAKLLRFYLGMGFKDLGVRYVHPLLGGLEHSVFLGDLRGALEGRGINPLWWNVLFADMWSYMRYQRMISPSPATVVKLGLFRLANPLARWMRAHAHHPRKSA
jgi:predicted GNAT family N-acyltransferase